MGEPATEAVEQAEDFSHLIGAEVTLRATLVPHKNSWIGSSASFKRRPSLSLPVNAAYVVEKVHDGGLWLDLRSADGKVHFRVPKAYTSLPALKLTDRQYTFADFIVRKPHVGRADPRSEAAKEFAQGVLVALHEAGANRPKKRTIN